MNKKSGQTRDLSLDRQFLIVIKLFVIWYYYLRLFIRTDLIITYTQREKDKINLSLILFIRVKFFMNINM